MRWVAFMPLRANSRTIVNKNLRSIAGKPLYSWSLTQAITSQCFTEIYVATNSQDIRESVTREFTNMVTVLDRSPENCTDTASTESAMLEFQKQVPFDVICLIQATSPLTMSKDFLAAKQKFIDEELDSLVTTVSSKRFFWTNEGKPLNYDPNKRPRRQDFDGWQMENGAFYMTRSRILEDHGCRLGGRIGVYEMAAETAVEIDEETDWIIVERLLQKRKETLTPDRTTPIEVLVVDVDGTLTDAGMYYGADGEMLKKFNTRDGHGLQRLRNNGIKVCVISAETSSAVGARMKKLGIDAYYHGVKDKLLLLDELIARWNISLKNVAYVGDDLGDLECMKHVGVSFCPADAIPEILKQADYKCKCGGGAGAVREVCELVLAINARVIAASPPAIADKSRNTE